MKYVNYYLPSKNYANRTKSSTPNILSYTLKQKSLPNNHETQFKTIKDPIIIILNDYTKDNEVKIQLVLAKTGTVSSI